MQAIEHPLMYGKKRSYIYVCLFIVITSFENGLLHPITGAGAFESATELPI